MSPGPQLAGVDAALVEAIAARAAEARVRIVHAGGDPELVRIVAVTKGFGPDEVAAAFAAGLTDFGENYADELISKWETVGRAARWHFLGAVQRNKVGRLAPFVDCWQAVARVVEGEAIKRHRAEISPGTAGPAPQPAGPAAADRPGSGSSPRRCWWRSIRPVLRAGAAACRNRCPVWSQACGRSAAASTG